MIATMRADGTFVLGDEHGDFVEPEECGWAVNDRDAAEEIAREVQRRKWREQKQRERASAPEYAKTCPVCGARFVTRRERVKRCETCRAEDPKGKIATQIKRRRARA